jgi:hypothetical protein
MIPIFRNEVIGAVGGDFAPRYRIAYDGGVIEGAALTLANPITQEGTAHSADMMNALFDFDNRAGMPGTTLSVSFDDGVITEALSDTATGDAAALRVTSFGNGAVTSNVYVYDGSAAVRHTTSVTTFDGGITEVVS